MRQRRVLNTLRLHKRQRFWIHYDSTDCTIIYASIPMLSITSLKGIYTVTEFELTQPKISFIHGTDGNYLHTLI